MRKSILFLALLPLLLFSQPYGSLGPSKIFLNSFENLSTFPSAIPGYTNFITFSTGDYIDPLGLLYKFNQKIGLAVYLNDSTANGAITYSRGFWDAGVRIEWSENYRLFVPSISHATPFTRMDLSAFVNITDGELKSWNFKATHEITEQKVVGLFLSQGKDYTYALADFLLTPTENRIIFTGVGYSKIGGTGEKFITLGAYFPVSSWLYFKISGDYLFNWGRATRRLGINLRYRDFLMSFSFGPEIAYYVPYFLSGQALLGNLLISTTILYRFYTF